MIEQDDLIDAVRTVVDEVLSDTYLNEKQMDAALSAIAGITDKCGLRHMTNNIEELRLKLGE